MFNKQPGGDTHVALTQSTHPSLPGLDVAGPYRRVVLEYSGEMFRGKREHGIHWEFLMEQVVPEIIDAITNTGVQMLIVPGGGNFMRGASLARHGARRVTADKAGMRATEMNGIFLRDAFIESGWPEGKVVLQSRIQSDIETYHLESCLARLNRGQIVILCGGTGLPMATTDKAAIQLAAETECGAVLKATKVDGIYDSDPATNPGASKHDEVDYLTALTNPEMNFMDNPALALAMEHPIDTVVFDPLPPGNIRKVVQRDPTVGSIMRAA